MTLVRDLTIPCCEQEKWNRWFLIIMPITSVLFVSGAIESNILLIILVFYLWEKLWYVTLIIFITLFICCILLWRFTYRTRLPSTVILLSILCFLMSLIWIWATAKVLVHMLDFIGIEFGITSTFLSMTLLAIGNSTPGKTIISKVLDLSVNVALAKTGFGEMAIAGSVAGPLFNLLIGLGASLIKKNISLGGPVPFDLYKYSMLVITVSIGLLGLNIIRLLIMVPLAKFKLTKPTAIIGYISYVGFVIAIILFTFVFK